MINGMKTLTHCLLTGLTTAVTAASTTAAELPAEPQSLSEPSGQWISYLVGFVLIGAVVAASFKSSKRTHLD